MIVNKEKQIHGILLLNLFINSNATIESNGIAFQGKYEELKQIGQREIIQKKNMNQGAL